MSILSRSGRKLGSNRRTHAARLRRSKLRTRRLQLELLEPRHLLAAVHWDGGGGDLLWSNPLNWSNDQLPTAEDDVVISATGTIVHNVGATQVRSLDLQTSLNVNGGSITVDGTFTVSAGRSLTASGDGVSFVAAGQSNINGVSVYVESGATVELPSVASYVHVFAGNSTLAASGEGSLLSLTNLATITGRTDAHGTLHIQALSGGRIDLASATEVVSGAVHFKAAGEDSIIELPLLSTFQGYLYWTGSGFQAVEGGTIVCPNLTHVNTADITLDASGVMDTGQIVSYGGWGTLSVPGIARDFRSLTTLNWITLNASGIAPQMDALANIDGSSLLISDGAELVLPLVTSYTHSIGWDSTLAASGEGSLLSLPNLATITGRTDSRGTLHIQALSGGRIDLASATEVVSGAVHFKAAGEDSIIELPLLSTFQGYLYWTGSGFQAVEGGTIVCPNLTHVNTADITLDASGVMDTGQIVSYGGWGTLSVPGIARDFRSLTTLNWITLNASGIAPQMDALANIDGSSLLISDGAELVLPLVTSYTHSIGWDSTLAATDSRRTVRRRRGLVLPMSRSTRRPIRLVDRRRGR
jgi:hypothetical protein